MLRGGDYSDVLYLVLQNKRAVDRVFERFILLNEFEDEENELQILRRDIFARRANIETTFRANSRINPSTQKMDAWKVNTVKSFNKQLDNFVSKIHSYLTIKTELLKRKTIHAHT